MTGDQISAAEVEVRRWRIERSAVEAVWLILMRERLRKGTASTRELAEVCGIPAGREFGRFRECINRTEHIVRAGEAVGPTGHLNIVWALKP